MGVSSRVQPPWPARLDPGSPYLDRLTHAVLPGYLSGAVNLVTGEKPTTAGSGITVSATSAGRAARFGNVELQYSLLPANASLSGADDITMLVVHQYNGDTSINQSVVGISSDLCFVSPNGTTASVAIDTSAAATNNFTTLPALVSGRRYVAVLTKTAADSYTGWLDGTAGTPATVSSTWAAGGVVSIGRSQTSKAHKGDIALVLIWNRVLSDNEIVELSANPWQIFKAPRRVYKAPAAGGGVTVAVPTGALTIAGLAPTVLTPRTVAVPAGALTLTGFAPAVLTPRTIAVPAAALTLTGFAPTVAVTANVRISVPAAALTLTGFAPTVTASGGQVVLVPATTLSITAFPPAVLAPRVVPVPAGALTLTGFAPAVLTPRTVQVPAGALTLTGFAPTVSTTQNVVVAVPPASLTLTAYAPTVIGSTITSESGGWPVFQYRRKKKTEPQEQEQAAKEKQAITIDAISASIELRRKMRSQERKAQALTEEIRELLNRQDSLTSAIQLAEEEDDLKTVAIIVALAS